MNTDESLLPSTSVPHVRLAASSLLLLALAHTVACAPTQSAETPPQEPEPAPAATSIVDAEAVPRDDAPAADAAPQNASLALSLQDVGFQTPECVYFDEQRDRYLVSNISGAPLDKDGNGFISVVTPEGEVELKWIQGNEGKFTLNAPKGMVVVQDKLYVADIDQLHLFEAASGKHIQSLPVKGAQFLNALAVGGSGEIYISDTAVDATFTTTSTDAIYVYKDGKVSDFARTKQLGSPNGLLVDAGKLWVNSFGSGELYSLAEGGEPASLQKLNVGQLDGFIKTNAGDWIISSWEGSSLLRGTPEDGFIEIIDEAKAPAAIGYDSKRNRVLVPLFLDNEVRFYQLNH